MAFNPEIPKIPVKPSAEEALRELGKEVLKKSVDTGKEVLKKTVGIGIEARKNISEWFSKAFNIQDKGLCGGLMVCLVGFIDSLFKGTENTDKPKTETAISETTTPPAEQKPPAVAEAPKAPEPKAESVVTPETPKVLDHTTIESNPSETSQETGITLCSGTALKNFRDKFGFTSFFPAKEAVKALEDKNMSFDMTGLPSGNADDVQRYYTLSDHQKIVGKTAPEIAKKLARSSKRLADVCVKSESEYEHRAVAFKSDIDGKWYILDPYRNNKSQKPIPFEQYSGKIVFVVPLEEPSKKKIS